MSAGRASRAFMRAHCHGVLATISGKLGGYPFGSIVPYACDHLARPVILISRIAEHTKNIDADPRVSLLVHEPAADVQASARLTLVGNAEGVGSDLDSLRARYLSYHPAAGKLIALGDFAFYRIAPLTVRHIGGFGAIRWISAADYAPPVNSVAECEQDIVSHMNADHSHNLRDYCRYYKEITASAATMIGIDCDGFDVLADGKLLRFDFEQPVTDAGEARSALNAMARLAKAS